MATHIPTGRDKKEALLEAIKQLPDEKTKTKLASFVVAVEDVKDNQMEVQEMKELQKLIAELKRQGAEDGDDLYSRFDEWLDTVKTAAGVGAAKDRSDQPPLDPVEELPSKKEAPESTSSRPDSFEHDKKTAKEDIKSYKDNPENKKEYDKLLNDLTTAIAPDSMNPKEFKELQESFDDLAAIQIAASKSGPMPKSPSPAEAKQSKAVMLQELKAVGNLLNKASGKSQDSGVLNPGHVKTAVGLSQKMAQQVTSAQGLVKGVKEVYDNLARDNETASSALTDVEKNVDPGGRLKGMFTEMESRPPSRPPNRSSGSKGGG